MLSSWNLYIILSTASREKSKILSKKLVLNALVIILIYIFHKQDSAGINQSLRMEIRLQERKALVQDYCKRHNRHNTVIGRDLRHFLVFRSAKVIYCFIPKVSSSEWKKQLSALVEEDKQIYGDVEKGNLRNNLRHFPRQEVQQMLNNYFTFLFVRDPMERVLSAYKNKFLKDNKYFHRRYGRDIIKQYRLNATQQALKTGSGVTFPEFTKYLVKIRSFNEHWAQFDKLCHPCAVNYDFIGRYENLAEDAPYLIKKAGIDDRVSFPPFRPSNTTAEMLHYYSQIPKQRILQMAKIYESDYEMFGYSFPGRLGAIFNSIES